MEESRKKLYETCKKKLLEARQDRLNGIRKLNPTLATEITGDEGDMAKALEDQHSSLSQRERFMTDLREIDNALSRLENGSYGYCEETGEPIEPNRLLALPWTRLSLEGAEIRELTQRRFA